MWNESDFVQHEWNAKKYSTPRYGDKEKANEDYSHHVFEEFSRVQTLTNPILQQNTVSRFKKKCGEHAQKLPKATVAHTVHFQKDDSIPLS